MSIEVRHIHRRFGAYTALDDINLSIAPGELVSLLGPSGSGKTTLLRIIAGLEHADSGHVLLHGKDATSVPVRERQVGFVFQNYALFRHMSVFKNIAFGLHVRPRKEPKEAVREKVLGLLKLMQLEGLEQRYPHQLSGGQRQRVALARALATDPKVLLLDEPFGALDARVRVELRRWLRLLHSELRVTSVFVTHDQDEALEVADRVVVMNRARIEQVGTPQEIYDQPATPFVHEFLGKSHGLRVGSEPVFAPHLTARGGSALESVTAYVRPHQVGLSRTRNAASSVPVRLTHIHTAGPIARIEMVWEGEEESVGNEQTLSAEISREDFASLGLRVGDPAFAELRKIKVFGS